MTPELAQVRQVISRIVGTGAVTARLDGRFVSAGRRFDLAFVEATARRDAAPVASFDEDLRRLVELADLSASQH